METLAPQVVEVIHGGARPWPVVLECTRRVDPAVLEPWHC